jgi:hypothetical protein
VALALSVLTLLISGRRAFWVIAALSPFVVMGLLKLAGMRTNLLKLCVSGSILGIVSIIFIVPSLNLDLTLMWEDVIKGFDIHNREGISSFRRNEQFFALTDGWMDSPILGAGHGAMAADNALVEEQPWAYELSYMALLFQTGLIGILIYGSAVVWIFIKGITVMRRTPESAGLLVPTLSGLFCFLVANATNPYLQKFDYLWTLFLPIAVLNSYMLQGNR